MIRKYRIFMDDDNGRFYIQKWSCGFVPWRRAWYLFQFNVYHLDTGLWDMYPTINYGSKAAARRALRKVLEKDKRRWY